MSQLTKLFNLGSISFSHKHKLIQLRRFRNEITRVNDYVYSMTSVPCNGVVVKAKHEDWNSY